MQLRSGKKTSKVLDSEERQIPRIVHSVGCKNNQKSLTSVTCQATPKGEWSFPSEHWTICRSPKETSTPKINKSTTKTTSSKSSLKKNNERIQFYPSQIDEESIPSKESFYGYNANYDVDDDDYGEDSLQRVSIYKQCFSHNKKPPRFILSDDEETPLKVKNVAVTSQTSGSKVKGTPSPKVSPYWISQKKRKEHLVEMKKEQPKNTRKRQLITGINKVPLSFIAKMMKRSPLGPFYMDGVECRQFRDKVRLENAADLPCIDQQDNDSSKTLDYSKEDIKNYIFPPRGVGEKMQVKMGNNKLEVIGNFYEVLLEGKVLWKAEE